jgi:hypothetical protein
LIVTGIGSRDIDAIQFKICQNLATVFANKGWHLRSGGARGADSAWELGFSESDRKTIYLPEPNFNGRPNTGCYKVPDGFGDVWFEAREIATRLHSRFDQLDEFAQNAHTRNVFQVLGDDLKSKADLVVVCAPPRGRTVKGGTATAFNLAKGLRITTFNLWEPQDREALYKIYAQELMQNEPDFRTNTGHDLFAACTDSP